MNANHQQAFLNFYSYPPVGQDDWEYAFGAARASVLEAELLGESLLREMANSENLTVAIETLNGTEYALDQQSNAEQINQMLLERRTEVRELFAKLMINEEIVTLIKSRSDFANMRLAIRRLVMEKPIGVDYSNDGNVPAEILEHVFEAEDYHLLPNFLQQAVEDAVLGFYQNKDIRQIDHAVDLAQAGFNLACAEKTNSMFLAGLFSTDIDLTNIRTVLRLKFVESDDRGVFIPGGYVDLVKLIHCIGIPYETIAPLFSTTPYYGLVETGVHYLTHNNSFLKLEAACDEHLMGFLKTTRQITAGPQPIIAYLLRKEHEIRMVRMILTAKRNGLDAKLILDRLPVNL